MKENLDSHLGLISLHFDVPEHHIPLSQFIDSAKSAQEIIDNFNQEFFENCIKYEVRVITPQKGGVIELLGIGVAGYILEKCWNFLESDIGKAYIKGLTSHEPTYWAEQLGKKTKELAEIDKKKLLTAVLALMVMGFLQKDTADLQKTGLSKEKFRAAYSARNRVYEACIKNPEVQGLGFDTSHDFPIKRTDFPRFIVDIPAQLEPPEIEDNKIWTVDTVDLIVHSPNWKRDNKRKWQGSTTDTQDIAFIVEDDNFWHHVKIKDIDPDINDSMRVQWAYPAGAGKPANVRVMRVISYNGKEISDKLSETELFVQLTDFKIEQKEQVDLFSYNQEDKK
ncbi:MAG: hypothetical protein WC043_03515 [Pseudobdellovibrionaceae bacterium]